MRVTVSFCSYKNSSCSDGGLAQSVTTAAVSCLLFELFVDAFDFDFGRLAENS
jgi:hypothetical protein